MSIRMFIVCTVALCVPSFGAPSPAHAQEQKLDGNADVQQRELEAKAKQADARAQGAEKTLTETMKAVGALEQQVRDEKAAKEAAEIKAAEFRSGKLIQYGVTGGVALGINIPIGRVSDGDVVQKVVAFATVPYIMFVPGYWGGDSALNTYCATQWTGTSFVDASKAAEGKAKSEAKLKYDAILARLSARDLLRLDAGGATKELDLGQVCPSYTTGTPGHPDTYGGLCKDLWVEPADVKSIYEIEIALRLAALKIAAGDAAGAKEAAAAEKRRDDEVAALSGETWDVTARGNCAARKIGLWVGVPLDYSAKVEFGGEKEDERPRVTRDVDAIISFGAAFIPNSYVSVLFGATYGTALRDVEDEDSSDAVWVLTTAIGGNLDLAALLVK